MNDELLADPRASGPTRPLRDRAPAADAITQFLRVHDRAAARSGVARLFGASVLSEESRRWYWEAVAELAVAHVLDRLGAEWVVLHAIRVESRESAIDHVLIGPGGVFTLSSNHHGRESVAVGDRRFHVAGSRFDHIRNTEFDIGRVERRLSAASGRPVHVVGVIVVGDPRTLTVQDLPRDIAVVRADDLVDWLHARPRTLEPTCVTAVAAVADLPSTWVPGQVQVRDADDMMDRFDAVRREVRKATIAHRLWLVGVCSGLVGMLALAAWGVLLQTI